MERNNEGEARVNSEARGEEGDNERDGEKGAEMASLCVGKGTKGREERVKRKVGRRKQNFTPPSLNSDCNCNTIF